MKTKTVLAIDPGNVESAYVLYNGETIIRKGKVSNQTLLNSIYQGQLDCDECLIEMISSYGMAVGQTTFDTCVWIGRFYELCTDKQIQTTLIFRKTIKMHHCGNVRAKDAEVNQALKDKYGQDHTKNNPNKFYDTIDANRMNGDIWSALALATYYFEDKPYPHVSINDSERNKITSNLL